jgi:hypothetical protein
MKILNPLAQEILKKEVESYSSNTIGIIKFDGQNDFRSDSFIYGIIIENTRHGKFDFRGLICFQSCITVSDLFYRIIKPLLNSMAIYLNDVWC